MMDTTREYKIEIDKAFFHNNNDNFVKLTDKEVSEFYQFVKFMEKK